MTEKLGYGRFAAHGGDWSSNITEQLAVTSPDSLAGWMVEKFRAWSDCDGDVETCFTKDELLTYIPIYWVSGTINSACRYY